MISHHHKCIFVHLRRTGGNSIELALGGIVLLDRQGHKTTLWDNNLHRGRNTPYKLDYRGHHLHDTAMAIKKQFPEEFRSYSRFSVVRNPWDQMISLYLRLNATDNSAINFKGWLKSFSALAGTVPAQSIFEDDGTCLVQEIGRYENLATDFVDICGKFGINADPLHRTNASNKKPYAEYYDAESREQVSRIFSRDIAHFGFRFER